MQGPTPHTTPILRPIEWLEAWNDEIEHFHETHGIMLLEETELAEVVQDAALALQRRCPWSARWLGTDEIPTIVLDEYTRARRQLLSDYTLFFQVLRRTREAYSA